MPRRKKVRGLTRHLESHLVRTAAPIVALDFAALAARHYEYAYFGLAPWAVNEKPPFPIRRLWVAHLVAGYFSWQRSLQNYPHDYFLAVCLNEPDFADSRLIVGIQEYKIKYEQWYSEPEEMLPLPPEYRSIPGVNDLHWTTHRRAYTCSLEDFQEDVANGYKPRHSWPQQGSNGEPLMLVQVGWVWVGRAPATT